MMQDPEIFRTVLESLPIGVYMVDRDLKVIFWNRGAERISGYLAQDVIGRHCREKLLVGLDESDPATGGEASQLTNSLRDGQPIEADVFLRHRSGHRIPVHVCAVPLRNSQDKIVGAAEIFEENRFAAAGDRRTEVETSCTIDSVTGLPDNEATGLKLKQAFTELVDSQVPFCILCVQVDGLSGFQSNHGKEAVDAALRVVAQTLRNALRPSDVVGCWPDEQFLAIVKNCRKAALKIVGERLRKMVSFSGVEWWGDELSVTVSMGGDAAAHDDTAESLVARAQVALSQSQADGGDRVLVSYGDENHSLKV